MTNKSDLKIRFRQTDNKLSQQMEEESINYKENLENPQPAKAEMIFENLMYLLYSVHCTLYSVQFTTAS